jgi:hypothetical protein
MKKNTYTLAYEACEKLFSESGQIPTIEVIKQLIGISSLNTISIAIKDWKKNLSKTRQVNINDPDGTPSFLHEIISDIWQQALLQATDNLQAQWEECRIRQQLLADKESDLIEERIRALHSTMLTEQKLQEEITNLKNELAQITLKSAQDHERIDNLISLTSELKSNNSAHLMQLNEARENFVRLEKQYNKEHDWALKRIDEEKSLCQQNAQHEIQRLLSECHGYKKSAALLQAKVDAMAAQTKDYQAIIGALEKRLSD